MLPNGTPRTVLYRGDVMQLARPVFQLLRGPQFSLRMEKRMADILRDNVPKAIRVVVHDAV